MSATTDWNPSGHPVHRLIQYLDAAITAFNAFRAVGRIPDSAIADENFQYWTDEARDAYTQLAQDYNRVIDEIFVERSSGPVEVNRHLEDSCVAYLVRQGGTDLEVPIRAGCETLGYFFLPRKGDLASPGVSNRGVERFLEAIEVRDNVVSVLARIGEDVPEDIRRRLQKENMEAGKLPTTDELLTRVRAARPSTELVIQSVAPGKVKGKRINARMLEALTQKPESMSWSASTWATYLDCVEGTVKGTRTWKIELAKIRATIKADRKLKRDLRRKE